MSLPPPPGPYGSQPPVGGGQPSWGGVPQGPPAGQPLGYGGPPQGPPPWGGQPWPAPAGPPPGRGGRGKWILGGLAVVLVVVLAVVITVFVVKPDSDGDAPAANAADSEFASAGDVGPVNIITEDPTCEAWGKVSREYAAKTEASDWVNRDKSVPATSWDPNQRLTYESVATAMNGASEAAAKLAKATPHRAVRELYEQFVAYVQQFTSAIPNYTPEDDQSAAIANTLASALSSVCSAIQYGSAQAIAPLMTGITPSGNLTAPSASSPPAVYLANRSPACVEWESAVAEYNRSVTAWQATDPSVSFDRWSPEQRAIFDNVAPIMSAAADNFERIGRSDNATFEDFALLTSQYLRAYVKALPSYSSADSYLVAVANYAGATNQAGCKALAQ